MKRAAIAVWTVVLLGTAARAEPGVDAEQFHPSTTTGGYFAVDGAWPVRHLGVGGGLWFNYAHDPLLLRDANGNVPAGGEVIGHQVGVDFVASLGIADRLELGIGLPLVAYQQTDNRLVNVDGGLAAAGLGDVRLDLKILLAALRLGGANQLGIALIAGGTAPTGDGRSFMSQGGWVGRPRLVVEWRGARARVGLDVGAVFRGERRFAGLDLTYQLSYGVGARVRAWRQLEVVAEAAGLVGLGVNGGTTTRDTPLEVRAGVSWRAPVGLSVDVGGGVGLLHGYGTPDGRVLIGLGYATPPPRPPRTPRPPLPTPPTGPRLEPDLPVLTLPPADRDHDGVIDSRDRCPDVAGVAENDGCPDIDSDGDGIVDRLDKCPFDAEVWNGVADDDGCPDAGAPLVDLRNDRIALLQPLGFDGTKLDERSRKVVGVVAALLRVHPEILKLRIEGHTDGRGSAVDNLDLSRARAAAVRRLLVEAGIDGQRLVAQGYGPNRPIADNRTEAGRAKNRRIDLIIIEKAGVP